MDHSRFDAYRRILPDIVPIAATTAAKPWAMGSLTLLLLGTRPGQESRRADSNRLPLLITSDRSCVAGVCRGLQMPLI